MSNRKYSYLIIGCGHFGSRAARILVKKDPHAKITVVDQDKQALQRVSPPSVKTIVCEGRSFLEQFISERQKVDYIIPAVPFHLAFEFILSQLKPLGARRKKAPSLSGLPNLMKGKTGDLYTSLSDFLCPENCPEPAQYCTVTKKRRPKPLYKILSDLEGDFDSRVIRSQQLAPGVGGFRTETMLKLLKEIKERMDLDRPILISTASRCHGVTSALSF